MGFTMNQIFENQDLPWEYNVVLYNPNFTFDVIDLYQTKLGVIWLHLRHICRLRRILSFSIPM
jgi:hypothetical protein